MQENVTKQSVIENLQNFINFIENMEAIAKNPYASGLKEDELLSDIKNYISETIGMVARIEEVTTDSEGEPEPNPSKKAK